MLAAILHIVFPGKKTAFNQRFHRDGGNAALDAAQSAEIACRIVRRIVRAVEQYIKAGLVQPVLSANRKA